MITRGFNSTDFAVREEENEKVIEGYFSVFNSPYWIEKDCYETVSPSAFNHALDADIRALINHDTGLVLGRTKAGTLELRVDEVGLFGRIRINTKDTDAMNIYERVKRGDVSQCSFGFDILAEDTEILEDGTVHWTITDVRLYEVSVVTFPAYSDTSVTARCAEADEVRKQKAHEAWKIATLAKLRKE